MAEQKFRMIGSAAYLIQLPLFHAITYMQNRLKGEEQQNFTMASTEDEVYAYTELTYSIVCVCIHSRSGILPRLEGLIYIARSAEDAVRLRSQSVSLCQ